MPSLCFIASISQIMPGICPEYHPANKINVASSNGTGGKKNRIAYFKDLHSQCGNVNPCDRNVESSFSQSKF